MVQTMLTPFDLADRLEGVAAEIIELPGISRNNPHAFAEAKSELAGAVRRWAKELRTVPLRPGESHAPSRPAVIRPGTRTIDRREIQVEVRGGRRPRA